MPRYRLHKPRHRPPRLADLHRKLLSRLAAMPLPPEPAMGDTPVEQAAGLRRDAEYLAQLQHSLEPIVEHVLNRAVDAAGLRDVRDAANMPYSVLDDDVLAEMRRRADDLEREDDSETLRGRG